MNLHEPQISRGVRWQWWQITHPVMSYFIHLSSLLVAVGVCSFFLGRASLMDSGIEGVLTFLRGFLGSWPSLIIAAAGISVWVRDRTQPIWRRFLENYRLHDPELATQFEALGRRDGLFPYEEKFTENKSD